jgi:hypothetical protein
MIFWKSQNYRASKNVSTCQRLGASRKEQVNTTYFQSAWATLFDIIMVDTVIHHGHGHICPNPWNTHHGLKEWKWYVLVSSSVITNVPLWWVIQIIREAICTFLSILLWTWNLLQEIKHHILNKVAGIGLDKFKISPECLYPGPYFYLAETLLYNSVPWGGLKGDVIQLLPQWRSNSQNLVPCNNDVLLALTPEVLWGLLCFHLGHCVCL